MFIIQATGPNFIDAKFTGLVISWSTISLLPKMRWSNYFPDFINHKKVISLNFCFFLLSNVILGMYAAWLNGSICRKEGGIQVLAGLTPSSQIVEPYGQQSLAENFNKKPVW